MSIANIAAHLKTAGRGPDTQLVHMSDKEVASLQALAQKHGGSLTINPNTGLPEAGFLDSILPTLVGVGASLAFPGISPLLIAGGTGLITGAATGSAQKGLLAGLGAWGGSSLAGGLMGAGESALQSAIPTATGGGIADIANSAGVAGQTAAGTGAGAWGTDASIAAQYGNPAAQGALPTAESAVSQASNVDKLSAGFNDITKDPLKFLANNKFATAAALAPVFLDSGSSNNSAAATQNKGQIRNYTFGQTQNPYFGQQGQSYFSNQGYADGPHYAAKAGGAVPSFAEGGLAAVPQEASRMLPPPPMGTPVFNPQAAYVQSQFQVPQLSAQEYSPQWTAQGNHVNDLINKLSGASSTSTPNTYSTPSHVNDPSVAAYNNLLMGRANNEYVNQPQLGPEQAFPPRNGPPPPPPAPNTPATPANGAANGGANTPASAGGATPSTPLTGNEVWLDSGKWEYGAGNHDGGYANGGLMQAYTYASGGGVMPRSTLGSYSDGGQLLRGPGDGVSDDIPAVIGGHTPARLASNEFVIPARIVSELGNGSTEAGAKQLYAMMDRVQKRRSKSMGKGRVAVDTKAYKELPA